MPIKTGRYFITNVKFRNQAVLPNSNSAEPVQTRYREDQIGEQVSNVHGLAIKSFLMTLTESGTSLIAGMDIMELKMLATAHNTRHLVPVLKREIRLLDGKEIKRGLFRKLKSQDNIR